MGHGVVRLQSDGLAVLGDGLLQLPLFRQGAAQVGVGHGPVRLQSDGLPIVGDSFFVSPELREDNAPHIAEQSALGPQGNNGCVITQGFLSLRRLVLPQTYGQADVGGYVVGMLLPYFLQKGRRAVDRFGSRKFFTQPGQKLHGLTVKVGLVGQLFQLCAA